jgi:hypothetical protein
VKHRSEGALSLHRGGAATVSRSMVDHVIDRVFEGNLAAMVSHLLTTREVSREELGKLNGSSRSERKSVNLMLQLLPIWRFLGPLAVELLSRAGHDIGAAAKQLFGAALSGRLPRGPSRLVMVETVSEWCDR